MLTEPETVWSDFTTAAPDLALEDCVDELLTVAVAVKVTVPSPTAVITPEESTVATAMLLDDHVTVVPVISSPSSSRTRADRSTVSPTGAHSLSSSALISTLRALSSGSDTVTGTESEQLFVVSDSSVTASTHAP